MVGFPLTVLVFSIMPQLSFRNINIFPMSPFFSPPTEDHV